MELVVIQLKDRRVIKLFYEHYVKGYRIQQYVKSYYDLQQAPAFPDEKKISSEELYNESFTVYKGNPLLSFRGICIWGFLIFFIVLTVKNGISSKSIVPTVIIYLIWYGFNAYFTFYIKVSAQYLVIKNYFIPFLEKKYRLSDIQEIAVETYPKWPNCLRVITNSFRYQVFPCGLLSDQEWKSFIAQIRKKEIKVRDEAIY